MKYGMHWRFPKIWNTFFIFFREHVILLGFFFPGWRLLKKGFFFFFHTSSWWHSLPSMQYINRWKLFLMCHCLSKMGIGSADEMTSTWRCRLYHMAVSLAIKKNWQARIAVVWAEGAGFLRESPILRVLTHFVVLVPGDLAPSEAGVVAWASCRMELLRTRSALLQTLLLCCRACCHAGTHGWTDTRTDRRTLAVRV